MIRLFVISMVCVALAGCVTAMKADSPSVVSVSSSAASTSNAPADAQVISASDVKADNPSRTVSVPFSISRVPDPAALRFNLVASTAGYCPTTYRPTVIELNDVLIQKIDFRGWPIGELKQLTLQVPKGALHTGPNVLQISSGFCQYEMDRITLDDILLVKQKI